MIFRAARHTNNLNLIKEFYTKILGLDFLGEFMNHNNYNGIFIGRSGTDWHLEFTESNSQAEHSFDENDCWVFYPSSQQEYDEIIKRVELNKIERVIRAKNPYWRANGIMLYDPDGCQIVISPQKIEE